MTQREANRNYYHNQSLHILSDYPLVFQQQQVKDYRYGRFDSAYCGCSWLAIYNLLLLLGIPHPPSVIIRWMERRPLFQGLFWNGLFGGYPWSVKKYLAVSEVSTVYGIGKKGVLRRSDSLDSGILFYLGKNGRGHFLTFQRREKETFHFINQRQGDTKDFRTMEEFLSQRSPLLVCGIFVSKEQEAEK